MARKDPLERCFRACPVPLQRPRDRKVAEDSDRVDVVGTVDPLEDRQGPFEVRLGLGVAALVPLDVAENAQSLSEVRMLVIRTP